MQGILIIDDDEGIRRSILRALKREPYEKFSAKNGEEGVSMIKQYISKISTVISDFKMPGIDGLETLLRIGEINPSVTRIILTGYATLDAAVAAANQGIDGFLTKPFDNRELKLKIHEITVRKYLRQFISEPVYSQLEHSSGLLNPTQTEVTVLFSDIRNFTGLCRRASPEAVAFFLNNHYFTPMGEIAHQFNGTIDKHIGDAIMVLFGSPFAGEDDADRAVQAALNMQEKAAEIDDRLKETSGLELGIGIGISTGCVYSGILGSLRKKEFTSIGLAVNIASRLESMANAGEILICERTCEKLHENILYHPLAPVNVKGVEKPVNVFRIASNE
ncbi:MAG: adenylate/guanylate cyclase domain-containing protein [Desulfobacterales bacterium]